MEIERKFTVKKLPDLSQYDFHVMEQGYLNTAPVVRVRKEDDNYYLTYRMRWKHDYTRYNSLTQLVYILDKDGNEIDYGRGRYSTFVGGTGSSMFDMPEDGVLYLQFRDGQMLVIDMKEYGYEEIENLN